MSISAADKGTGKKESLTITSEKGRLSEEDIERMVQEAEAFAEQDAAEKDKVQARNNLEAYLYNLKNSMNDALQGKLSDDDRKSLSTAVEDALVWLEDHPAAEKQEYDEKQKEVEGVANPILKRAYESANPAADVAAGSDDAYFEDLETNPNVEEVD